MEIKHLIREYIAEKLSDYVVKIKPVPDEDGVFSVDVFGVPRSDFRKVEDLIFDFIEAIAPDDIFVPGCFTKEEMTRYYPNITEEYRALHHSSKPEMWAKVFSAFLPNSCQCREVLNSLDIFQSPPQLSSGMIAREHSNTIDANESYLRAA